MALTVEPSKQLSNGFLMWRCDLMKSIRETLRMGVQNMHRSLIFTVALRG